uniref:Midasin n=1 Tax=Neolamprologus brichardi TaxID=32507 RepID=A0A3Q4MRM4_NEOBR
MSPQIWSQQDRQCILDCLAQLLLEKDYTLLIARHLRPLTLDLLERNAERVKAGGSINHDLHERLCVALSKLLSISPDAQTFGARYFDNAPPVFQRLFFTSEESSAVQYGPRRMKLRDLMGATLRFLQSDCAKFRMLWDWSPCMSLLLTSDVMVRWYTAHCLALVSHMTDNQKTIFLRKVLTSDEILHMKMKGLEETQQLEFEKALVLANQGYVTWCQEKANKFTRGQVVSEDLSQNVVAVCGVVLPRIVPRQPEQVCNLCDISVSINQKDLVLVDSTCRNLRRLALAVASQKPVLLEGPIGCGKTALVEFMAAVTGHAKTTEILKVQLGDQTDSKVLLGMYRCTDIPGKFIWQPGTLTQAVSSGQWILLEDIDHAPLDVISALLPLMENKKLMIPGREDCIDVAPGFQFFATRRSDYSAFGGSWHRPQNSHAVLLDKYWTKLQMGNMTREELKKVIGRVFMFNFTVVSTVDSLFLQKYVPKDKKSKKYVLDTSPLSLYRDLLKWCERISVNFDCTSSATAQHVFLEALDCFTAMLPHPESRLRMAEIIGSKLNISREKAQHFCQMYQPGILLTELEASVGRVTLIRKQTEAVQENHTFAATRPSAVLLEQLAVCVAKGEPVLLVGETGTGKTSTVQQLARITGHRLRVVNMNQQSDTADLLGGYKPVDIKQILLPLREAFEDLFSQTYSRKQNLTFLGHVQTCFRGKRWQDLLKLMDHVCKSALIKELQEKSDAALLQEQWEALASKLNQTQQQIRACETAMVFAFVEGTLAQAVKKGHWILLDEINLAAAETLECLSGLLEGNTRSLVLLDRGDTEPLVRHPDFRLFACMNPATDVGKRNLPLGLRNRFTELYVEELENEADLRILISDYLKCLNPHRSVISGIISFYLTVRKEANSRLVDGRGHRPHYSLRTLCRALKYAALNPCNNVQRSLYEGFCLSFLTQLDRSSHPVVQKLVCQHILMGNTKCLKQSIPAPSGRPCVEMEGYWVSQGEMEPGLDPSYILTPSVKLNLRDLARVVSAGTHPVLIQGETSVGKTSLIRWLAAATGNQCVRINNHEHTDVQEYIGCYSSDDRGKLVFKEGVLIDAMRKGYWIILDELNLAPTDVLEALNRLLDDNRELFVAETQEVISAHPRFMLFATQNPPGLYGGRKVLSRAFRNRFVELHFDELPSAELEIILHQRCSLPPSYCTKLVKVMQDLQSLRKGSSVFAGKHGFITLRDLFRWADRYRLEEQAEASRDWLQHLADDGYMLLAGRVRKPEEEVIILSILEKHFKRTVNPEYLFSQKQVAICLHYFNDSSTQVEFRHVVWTQDMRRLAVLLGRALRFGESVLLVGNTGCGKTTICQLFAALAGQKFFSVNCHLHMETSDFLGGLRPVRHTHQNDGEDGRLFEWHDGPLVQAMKEGGVFLMDEISLADDSVLERLNSVLETEKSLVLAEKGSGDRGDVELIKAATNFRLVATMNPGGDFGKKELSPALRNRFTELWCPQTNNRSDLVKIIQHNLRSGLSLDGGDVAELMLDFIEWLTQQDFGRRCILSVRDILSWVNFLNAVCERDEDSFMTMGAIEDEDEAEWDLRLDTVTAFIHAACLVYIDGIGSGTTASCADGVLLARRLCLSFLQQRLSKMTKLDQDVMDALRVYDRNLPREPQWGEDFFGIDPFYIALGPHTESRNLSNYAIAAGTTAVNAQRILRALKLQRPVLLEGSPGVGKTSLVAALAKASGNHLVRINLSEQTDVTDLFGTDLPVEGGKGGEFAWRDGPLLAALKAGHWVVLDELNLASQSVLEGLNACFDHRAEIYIPELAMSFQVQHDKTKIFGCQNPFTQGGGRKGLPKSFLNRFTQVFVDQLTSKDMEFIGDLIFPSIDKEIVIKMVEFSNRVCFSLFLYFHGSMLIFCLCHNPSVHFFSASVLDRLNALLEPGGSLVINERGVIDGSTPKITPHPNFRLFLTMDPVHGELSRAMRNRGVEIYIPGEHEAVCWDTLDLKTLLHTAGVTGDCVCDLLIEIHKAVKSAIWDSPASSVASLLHAATLLSCQLQRGVDLPSALQHACGEAYSFCQHNSANQKKAQQVIEQHLSILDTEEWGCGLLCAGVWPDSFPSALLSTEDSCFSTVIRDGQVLLFCLNTLSLQGKRSQPLSLSDLQRVLQNSGVHEGLVFSEAVGGLEDGNALRLIPTAVRLLTERASHGDWIMRSSWLSHLGKSHKYAPGLLQCKQTTLHTTTQTFRLQQRCFILRNKVNVKKILVDMRWNKQYLDILANKCNFEDEERYTEFLELTNTQILLTGTVDIGHLPHPVLMHLQTFFELSGYFILQAVQAGQPYISDHIMFEILQLLQWLDRFWDVCSTLTPDSQGISVLSLHWQWVQKHLILRLPQLLLGDELQATSTAIQTVLSTPVSVATALKGIQKTLGKTLPFKLESVAKCASQLRLLSKALDVSELKLDNNMIHSKQELVRLQGAGLGLDIKESLLEAWGLVLLANNQLDPQKSGELELQKSFFLLTFLTWHIPCPEVSLSNENPHLKLKYVKAEICVIFQPAEELPFVWCELLSEALSSLWTCSITSNPEHWLKWDPLNPETQTDPKQHQGTDNMVTGPALLSKAVRSHCVLEVLSCSKTGGSWEPSGEAFLSLSNVRLGDWKGRIQQLQDLSAVLWDNMSIRALADFRGTDFRLQGAVLRRQLQSMADVLPPTLQEGYMESCESLVEDPDPLIAAQEIQTVFRDFLPPKLLPDGLVEACLTCLQQYVQSKVQGSNSLARSGVFWVNMGLLQIKVWTPQTIFDPAVKRAYKLNYAQQELALLQEEWKGRSLWSQLMTGAELEESSTTDGFQHPRIRYLWIRMQQVKEQIAELSRKQACRPHEPQYGQLYQELQHYLCSIGQTSAIQDLLSQLLNTLEGSSSSKSKSAVQAVLKEEAVWQNSQQRFCQRLLEDYPLYPDVVGPVRTGILQLRYGMRLVASQVAALLNPVPGLPRLVSCLLAFPFLSPSLPSYLVRADFLCSRICMDTLRSLVKLLPQQDTACVIPQSCTLLLSALLYVQCHTLSAGEFSHEARSIFRHICQALVNEWDERERRRKEHEEMEASLYRSRSRLHGSGLTEDEQEERDFRRQFPQFNKDFADIVSEPSLEGAAGTSLEGLEDKTHEESFEMKAFSPATLNTVIQVHQRLCLGYAQSLWYKSTAPANHSKEHIKALLSSYQIASPVMSNFYHLIDSDLDQQLTGSELLLSAILQNTVQGSGGAEGLAITPDGPYDFYQHPNMSEASLCLPVLEQLSVAVKQRLEDWPGHPALEQLNVVMERIKAFNLASPVAKFLNGLEILLSKAQDWENNASRSVSLRKELEPVTQLIIQWRKLELSCWSRSLDNAMKRHTEKSTKHWFSVYQLLERYLEEQRAETCTGTKHLSLSSVSSTLQAFLEGSTLGEFHTRLNMLLTFHCHLLLVPPQSGQEPLSSLLWNLYKYYNQFSQGIQTKITQHRQTIEKDLKDFVKICKWNDVNFWSIKQSVEKTHRTLFKFIKQFEEALNGPSIPALVEQGSGASLDSVDANPQEMPIHRVHQLLKSTLPLKSRILQFKASSLQISLPVLSRKMKKMCIQLLKKNPVPELAEDLDCFTGEKSLTINTSADKDKQKAEIKHILQQKQRALSDLFKMLTEIGLSYRKGLIWNRTAKAEKALYMQPLEMTTALSAVKTQENLLTAWDGCQKYFYQSWARNTALQTALQHAAKELGLGNVERCRGFSSHLFKLLLKQRRRLAKLTEQWVHLRSVQGAKEDKEEPLEDLLKPGHLTRLLEEELEAEVEALRVGDVSAGLERLLCHLKTQRDSSQACRMLVRLEPLLGIYSDLVCYYLAVSLGAHRSTGKLLSVLASIFTELAQKGFCLPQELMAGDGEGAEQFHDYEGGGIGEGKGTKDVSDKIENEDQLEDTFKDGEEKTEQHEKEDIKSEDNAVEMSEDFDGQMCDADEKEPGDDEESDKEDDEELDKKMGDLGEGQTDTLDEKMWGDDDDDDDEEEGSDKEEESGQGMDQGESELVAKDDNLDAADPKKDHKNQDKDQQMDEEEKDMINEQGDEREFDENEVDPYHGQQDKRPEPEAMDLPEELDLDQGDKDGDDNDDGDEGEGETCCLNYSFTNTVEKHSFIIISDVLCGLEEEEGGGEDEELPECAERKWHDTDGQTGEDNIQSDTAVELAGEASERDEAKEEHGSGAADASQSEGHQSKLTATMASHRQTQSQTQSLKRKPGQADSERSIGDYNKPVNKRLRTVERSKESLENNRQSDTQQVSDLYEHIKHGDPNYDTQTYDVASTEQESTAGPRGQDEDDKEEDLSMETEDQEVDLQAAEVQELKPEQLDSSKASQTEMEVQRQGEEQEDERWKEKQQAEEEERASRRTDSTIHVVPELLLDSAQVDSTLCLRSCCQETVAASMWHQYQTLTSALSQQLCEQLRLILEPTQAAKLKGDYRTGKRLNMRKVIPYIASQFRKDKIWLRRTKPSKREYQICLAVDDSSSMVDNHSKQLAFESLAVIINALTLLEVGQVSVCSFGEQVQLLHPFQHQFNDESGARILRLCQFQTITCRTVASVETAQLLVIVSDGRGLFLEGKERVMAAVRAARSAGIFIIFMVLDNPNSRDSILDIKVPIFKGPGELPEIHSYMDEFPFPFYVILRDINALPATLSDALRQWFELVTVAEQ